MLKDLDSIQIDGVIRMKKYKALKKVGPCMIVADAIEKDSDIYSVRISVKRRSYSHINRTRKRQIEKAKWMAIQHDHTCYEWSQWWPKSVRKPKRWFK